MTRWLSLVAALSLAVVACGGTAAPAATVNDHEISQTSVTNELRAIGTTEEYAQAIEASTGRPVRGSGEGSYDAGFVAQVLTRQLVFELIGNEVDERGLEVTETEREAARRDLYQQLGAGDPEAGRELLESFPRSYQDDLVEWNAEALVLQGDLVGQAAVSEDAAREYYDENQADFEQVCARHILVDSQEVAQGLRQEILAGADFATVAAASSQDASAAQGGQLDCAVRGDYQPEFEEAAFSAGVGEVTEPVETVFGWHLIQVDERGIPPFEEVQDRVAEVLSQSVNERFSSWLSDTLATAEISVDPRYGRWDGEAMTVTPPEGPTTTTTEESGGEPAIPGLTPSTTGG